MKATLVTGGMAQLYGNVNEFRAGSASKDQGEVTLAGERG